MNDNQSVLDVLWSIDDSLTTGKYTVEFYRQVFAEFPMPAQEFIGSTASSMVLKLTDGRILNLTWRRPALEFGARPFDMPILETGSWSGEYDAAFWFVQPDGERTVKEEDREAFVKRLDGLGYRFDEPAFPELARYDGEVKLLDPFAVRKKVQFVPDVLWFIDPEQAAHHNLELYAGMFRDFPKPVDAFIGAGRDSIALRLKDGNILKISTQPRLPPPRPWDMPVLEQGTVQADRWSLFWFVQPKAEMPVAEADFQGFVRRIIEEGYMMTDPSRGNLGYHGGEVRLLDPFAVCRPSKDA